MPHLTAAHDDAVVGRLCSRSVCLTGQFWNFRAAFARSDVAAKIGPRLAKATLAAKVDGRLVGRDAMLPETGEVSLRLLTAKDPEALDILRHSSAHVMARAVMRLFEGVQLAFGPTVDNGFYYDFQMEHALSDEDFPRIEAEMARIVKEDEPFERVEMDRGRGDRSSAAIWASRSRWNTSRRGWPTSRPFRSIARASSSICAAGRTCPGRGDRGL